MIDTILTILGTLIFLPWVMQLISNPWQKTTWHRQLLVVALTFELIAVLHVPLVMYIGLGILLLSFSIYLIKERPKMRFTPFFVTALLYLVWYAVSLLWSADLQKGVLFLSDNGLVLVSISAITCFVQLKKDEYIQILQLFCYAACVFVVLCLLSWVISSYEIHLALWEWPILEKTLKLVYIFKNVDENISKYKNDIIANCLLDIANKYDKLYVYETDVKIGGLSSMILSFYNEHGICKPIKVFGIGDHFVEHGSIPELRKQEGIDITYVLETIEKEI